MPDGASIDRIATMVDLILLSLLARLPPEFSRGLSRSGKIDSVQDSCGLLFFITDGRPPPLLARSRLATRTPPARGREHWSVMEHLSSLLSLAPRPALPSAARSSRKACCQTPPVSLWLRLQRISCLPSRDSPVGGEPRWRNLCVRALSLARPVAEALHARGASSA